MLSKQNNYDFKSELLKIHPSNIIDYSITPANDEFVFLDGMNICLKDSSQVIITAVRDFEDYLYTSMNIGVGVVKNQNADIIISLSNDLTEGNGYMGYRISVNKSSVIIEGHDERGVAQALYYIEDLLSLRKAPFLKTGVIERKALFSPRLSQSPFGMFEWPDEAFKLLAHRGYDGVFLWLKDTWKNKRDEYIDIRLLSERAAKYGLDLYIQLFAPHSVHPDEENAQEFYDNLYGKFFERCPLLKGVQLVGEANNFKSRDPKVGLSPFSKNYIDNIPTGKTSPGWWPCVDYPQWVNMIKNAVRKYNPNAKIIFSTYNWGWAPEQDRINLINSLPTDITLNITWDMFHKFKVGDCVEDICDYSLSFEGPGEYFLSEATAAKNRGIEFIANANTSGRTWDFGVVPYEPMPQQWIRRYNNIIKAHNELGLAGIYENIHYAFQPSFIGDLEKHASFTQVEPLEKTLEKLLERDFGKQNLHTLLQATNLFSDAIREYIPTNEDQYGAFRIGPAYPLWSGDINGLPASIPDGGKRPSESHSLHGNGIYFGTYTLDLEGRNSLSGVRIFEEIKAIKRVENLLQQGIDLLEEVGDKNDNLLKLILLAKFMRNTCRTAISVKDLYIAKQKLSIIGDKQNAQTLIDDIENIILKERENVLDTIPIVELDSRLGWEPSMEYTTDTKGLEWKLRQLDYELTYKIPAYRKANSL